MLELPTVREVLPSVSPRLPSTALESSLAPLESSLPFELALDDELALLALEELLAEVLLPALDALAPLSAELLMPLVLLVDVLEPLLNIRLSVLLNAPVNLIRLLKVINIPPNSGKSAELEDPMHIGRMHINLLLSGSASRPFCRIPAELDLSKPSLPDMLVDVPKPPRVRLGFGIPELPGNLRN